MSSTPLFITMTLPFGVYIQDLLNWNKGGYQLIDKSTNQWKVDWNVYRSLFNSLKEAVNSIQHFSQKEDWVIELRSGVYAVVDEVITTAHFKSSNKVEKKESIVERFSKWFIYQVRLGY